MAEQLTARAYAQALFEKAVERFVRDLHALSAAVDRAGVTTRLDNPTEPFEQKRQVLNGVLKPQLDTEVRNLALLLASKNQLHLLREVVSEFDKLVTQSAPMQAAQVTSAVELVPDERARLEVKLRQQYGADLALEYRVDPSILGGMIVRVGDEVYDGSVKGKLDAMRARLEATG